MKHQDCSSCETIKTLPHILSPRIQSGAFASQNGYPSPALLVSFTFRLTCTLGFTVTFVHILILGFLLSNHSKTSFFLFFTDLFHLSSARVHTLHHPSSICRHSSPDRNHLTLHLARRQSYLTFSRTKKLLHTFCLPCDNLTVNRLQHAAKRKVSPSHIRR